MKVIDWKKKFKYYKVLYRGRRSAYFECKYWNITTNTLTHSSLSRARFWKQWAAVKTQWEQRSVPPHWNFVVPAVCFMIWIAHGQDPRTERSPPALVISNCSCRVNRMLKCSDTCNILVCYIWKQYRKLRFAESKVKIACELH